METNGKATYSNWGIKRDRNGRYVLYDTSTDDILDDAQGHGFETYEKAYNYGYNKYHTGGVCTGNPNADYYNTLF